MGIFLEKVQKIVNRRHEEMANNILNEVKAEVYAVRKGVRGEHSKTADSYHIMDDTGATVSGSVRTGKLFGRTITIGSNLPSAWYLEFGNNQHYPYFGGRNHPAMPNYKGKGAKILKYNGEYHLSSRTYAGQYPVGNVVARHGGKRG